jgi:hypothetical protein
MVAQYTETSATHREIRQHIAAGDLTARIAARSVDESGRSRSRSKTARTSKLCCSADQPASTETLLNSMQMPSLPNGPDGRVRPIVGWTASTTARPAQFSVVTVRDPHF